jgi:hypothetical protein
MPNLERPNDVGAAPAGAPTLAELEAVIEKGLDAFIEVGMALVAIKAGKKYRAAGYATFEDYCLRRWGMSREHGRRLVVAAVTARTN